MIQSESSRIIENCSTWNFHFEYRLRIGSDSPDHNTESIKLLREKETKSWQKTCRCPKGNLCQLQAPRRSVSPNLNLDLITKLLHTGKKNIMIVMIIRWNLMNKKHWKARAMLSLFPIPMLKQMTLVISMQTRNSVVLISNLSCLVAVRFHNRKNLKRVLWITKIWSLYCIYSNQTVSFFQVQRKK